MEEQGQPPETNLISIVNAVADRAENLVKLITAISEGSRKAQEARAQFSIRIAWVAVVVVLLIVGVSGFLTYVGKVDGSAFSFLIGVVIGYLLTFLREAVTPGTK